MERFNRFTNYVDKSNARDIMAMCLNIHNAIENFCDYDDTNRTIISEYLWMIHDELNSAARDILKQTNV